MTQHAMTDENEARARLLSHYLLKVAARKAELAEFTAGLARTEDTKLRMVVSGKITNRSNEIADLAGKIERLQRQMEKG